MSHYYFDRIPDPYAKLDRVRDLSRLSVDVSYTDKHFLKTLCPEKGLFNRMIAAFFASVAQEARESNLRHYDPQQSTELIRIINHRCQPRRCTPAAIAGKTVGSITPGGTPGAYLSAPCGLLIPEHLACPYQRGQGGEQESPVNQNPS